MMAEEDNPERRGYELIGRFIYQFSQLEFTIRVRLAAALKLPDEMFDIVTAPYDFAVLCTAAEDILVRQHTKYYFENRAELEQLANRAQIAMQQLLLFPRAIS